MDLDEKPLKTIGNDVIDILWAGILWLICSLPIVTVGAASCALYYTIVKVVRRKRETVVKAYFFSFRQNLRQGTLVTIIYAIWTGMISVIIRGYSDGVVAFLDGYVLIILLMLMGVPLLLTCVYIIPLISRFSMRLTQQFRLSLLLAIRHLPTTIYLIFLVGLVALILYQFTSLVFVVPGFLAFFSSLMIEKILVTYMKEEQVKFGELDKEAWYMEE